MSDFFKCYRNYHLRMRNHKVTSKMARRLAYWSRQLAKAEEHLAKRNYKEPEIDEIPF